MLLFAPKETAVGERRVAMTPDVIKRLAPTGLEFAIEVDAGVGADLTNAAYADAGAKVVDGAAGWAEADIVACVRPPRGEDVARMKAGALLIGLLDPHSDRARIEAYASANVAAFAFEFVPRISRAQGMDALSSQANLAGYAAVIQGASLLRRAFPMMVTAAGTVSPVRVLVLGAGVAGLQAIATARRLGAVVSAMDVREAAREQVESLGATFVSVESEEKGEGQGGYAREMSDDYQQRQAEKLRQTLARSDLCITTAQIPGRTAPRLVPADMLTAMRTGSILIDLAAAQGGNVEGSVPGETVRVDGVSIVGHADLPSSVSQDASNLYARNVANLVSLMIDQENKELAVPWDDEIVQGALVVREGAITHPQLSAKED